MPSELNNQFVRGSGGAGPSGHLEGEIDSRLLVLTFADGAQAESLYDALKDLHEKKIIYLEDAVFVTKGDDGKFKVDEKKHHEKRTGTAKGAVFGTLIGWMLGGPVLGLAGGAVVGRFIGKKMDLGIDQGTIDTIAQDLENDHTALFIMGYARQNQPVVDAFKNVNAKIIETTIEDDMVEKLQRALDS